MQRLRGALLIAFPLCFALSCGASDSQKAYNAASSGLSTASSKATTSVGALTAALVEQTVDVKDVPCAGGGTLDVSGTIKVGLGAGVEFDLTVKFDKCSEEDVTMDGTLTYSIAASATATGAGSTTSIKGDITYSDGLTITCPFDISWSTTADSSGASVQGSGTVCGEDVGSLDVNVPA